MMPACGRSSWCFASTSCRAAPWHPRSRSTRISHRRQRRRSRWPLSWSPRYPSWWSTRSSSATSPEVFSAELSKHRETRIHGYASQPSRIVAHHTRSNGYHLAARRVCAGDSGVAYFGASCPQANQRPTASTYHAADSGSARRYCACYRATRRITWHTYGPRRREVTVPGGGRARRLHDDAETAQVVRRQARPWRQSDGLYHRLPTAPGSARPEPDVARAGKATRGDVGANHHSATGVRQQVRGVDRRWQFAGPLLLEPWPERCTSVQSHGSGRFHRPHALPDWRSAEGLQEPVDVPRLHVEQRQIQEQDHRRAKALAAQWQHRFLPW